MRRAHVPSAKNAFSVPARASGCRGAAHDPAGKRHCGVHPVAGPVHACGPSGPAGPPRRPPPAPGRGRLAARRRDPVRRLGALQVLEAHQVAACKPLPDHGAALVGQVAAEVLPRHQPLPVRSRYVDGANLCRDRPLDHGGDRHKCAGTVADEVHGLAGARRRDRDDQVGGQRTHTVGGGVVEAGSRSGRIGPRRRAGVPPRPGGASARGSPPWRPRFGHQRHSAAVPVRVGQTPRRISTRRADVRSRHQQGDDRPRICLPVVGWP